jgi:hypothetical protein
MKNTVLLLAVAGLLGAEAPILAADDYPLRLIAYEVQAVPGGYLRSVGFPETDTGGSSVFYADFADHPMIGASLASIWRHSGGGLLPIVMAGDPVPGSDDLLFSGFGSIPRTSAPGVVVFTAVVEPRPLPIDDDEMICSWNGSIAVIAREASPAPSLEPLVYGGDFFADAVSPWGPIAFSGDLRGDGVDSTNDRAYFYAAGSGCALLFRHGVEFADGHPGVYIAGVGSATFDQAGRIAASVALVGPDVQPGSDQAILVGLPGSIDIAVRRGEPAAELSGLNYGHIGLCSMAPDGTLFFHAELNEPDMTSWAGEGLWYGNPGDLDLVALNGESLQGTNYTMHHFARPMQNAAGDLWFIARLDRNSREPAAVVRRVAGQDVLRTVAYPGLEAPGTTPGTVFTDEHEPIGPFLGAEGVGAFTWVVEGPDVDDVNRRGLWATNRDGQLALVARSGDSVEVDSGDTRVIQGFFILYGLYSGTDGNNVVSDAGELGLALQFTDGSHAVVSVDLTPCLADFNGDGTLSTLDVLAFLNAWVARDPKADVTGDGLINTLDVLWFLNLYSAGC